jgi:voltage-gated potassium channel
MDRLAHLKLRGAVAIIVGTAAVLSLVAATLERLIDPAFTTFGLAVWWAIMTVTTVGYGDIVPESPQGRVVASLLMLTGLGLIPILTSIVVSVLVAQRADRERQAEETEFTQLITMLRALDDRLERLEQRTTGD